jgi:hypothetical protein
MTDLDVDDSALAGLVDESGDLEAADAELFGDLPSLSTWVEAPAP